MVPQVGHSPSSPRSSSSTSASHSSHQATSVTDPSFSTNAHPQFHRGGPELELLPHTALDVTQVRLRQATTGEQGKCRRVNRALNDVADASPGGGLALLKLLN